MSANFTALAYLVSAILFVLALRGLSSPASSRRGNIMGMAGMAIAIIVTILRPDVLSYEWIIGGIVIGGAIGAVIAQRIAMTAMPQLVAAFHSLVGLAAVLVAAAAFYNPDAYGILGAGGELTVLSRIEMSIGVVVGAITFSGSIIAFTKLQGLVSGNPVIFPGQHFVNLLIGLAIVALIIWFCLDLDPTIFWAMTALAFLIGFLIIIPIGGADMPVVVSMLNSYSGWAAAGIGFTLENTALIIVGALVGSSEAGSADDAAFIMKNAGKVIIVPGYGLAVAQAQHALREMVDALKAEGVEVVYAIHPVAGRMPGHMNVLLAEAQVPYDEVFELEEINSDFSGADVALVVGANDVTNPAARDDPSSPIFGMPILDVDKARTVLFVKRSMSSGYAGIDNDLFYKDNTMMLLADAKKMVEDIIKAL